MTHARYIGDGVYASFDGYQIWITTGHHDRAQADAAIALEPEVFKALAHYGADLEKSLQRGETNREKL